MTTSPLGIQCVEEFTDVTDDSRKAGYDGDLITRYGIAHSVSTFISFVGFTLVVIGIFGAVLAAAKGMSSQYAGLSLVVVLPGLGTVVSGFILIMGAQVTKATLDNADHTREILRYIKSAN